MQLFIRVLIVVAALPLLLFGLGDLLLGMDPFGKGFGAHATGAMAVFTAAAALIVAMRPNMTRKIVASAAAAVLLLVRAVRFLAVMRAFLDWGAEDPILLSIVGIPPLLVLVLCALAPVQPPARSDSRNKLP